ncbi:MAG TPA: alpha/beta hydrolase [Jatrophihabitantaceae bacterium]|nr:alpha/beta hydrolase [Jatrophihabitantaceae bacterium]
MGKLADFSWRATGRVVSVPPALDVPEGSIVELPGRGSTFVVDTGPPEDPGRPTLVLLHALACTGLLTWYPAIAALRKNYRVITFDQRWHGQGIRSDAFRLEDCADDVAALADALELDRFVVAGYSMGSLVAQLTWRQHPDRVAGAVLAATTARFTASGREPAALRVASVRLHQAAAWRYRAARTAAQAAPVVTVPTDDHNRWALAQLRTTRGSGIAGAVATISRFDSSGWIGEMDVPTAVVVTAQDRLIPPARQLWVARQLPDVTVYEVEAGHSSVVMQAARFTPALQAACASVTARVAASAPR